MKHLVPSAFRWFDGRAGGGCSPTLRASNDGAMKTGRVKVSDDTLFRDPGAAVKACGENHAIGTTDTWVTLHTIMLMERYYLGKSARRDGASKHSQGIVAVYESNKKTFSQMGTTELMEPL